MRLTTVINASSTESLNRVEDEDAPAGDREHLLDRKLVVLDPRESHDREAHVEALGAEGLLEPQDVPVQQLEALGVQPPAPELDQLLVDVHAGPASGGEEACQRGHVRAGAGGRVEHFEVVASARKNLLDEAAQMDRAALGLAELVGVPGDLLGAQHFSAQAPVDFSL
jgi:hypothetical protein